METIALLVVAIILLLIELATVSLTTIWFSLGAFSACLVSLISTNKWVLASVFFVVSLGTLFLFRPSAVKHFNANREKTNCDSLIGKIAVVTEMIDNHKVMGTVVLNGQEWTARTVEDGITIPEGNKVRVVKISGVKLIVSDVLETNNVKEK